MEDKEFIERLEEIITAIKNGEREQAECDLADLYDEISEDYDNWDEDDDEEEDEFEEEDE